MWTRVFIPGFGNVWVETDNEAQAINQAMQFAASRGVQISPENLSSITATGSSGPGGAGSGGFSIGSDGTINDLNPEGGVDDPGATVDPGGTTDPTDTVDPIEGGDLQPSEIARDTQFRQFLRSGGLNPSGTVGSQLFNQSGLAQSLFDVGSLSGVFGPDVATTFGADSGANDLFQRFLQTTGIPNLGSNAQSTLRRLFTGNTPLDDTALSGLRNPAAGTTASADLANIAQLALGGRTSAGTAARLGPALIERIRQQFRDQEQLNSGSAGTFLGALNSGLGLGLGG